MSPSTDRTLSAGNVRTRTLRPRGVNGVHAEFRAKISRLLVERLRAGLWLLLASAVVFAAADVWLGGPQRAPLLTQRAITPVRVRPPTDVSSMTAYA